MLKRLYERLISDTLRTVRDYDARLQIHYRWILKILFLFIVIAMVMNFVSGNPVMAKMLLLLALCYFGFYWIVYFFHVNGVRVVRVLMTIQAIVLCMQVVITGTNDGYSTIWLLIMPPLIFLLMGRKVGVVGSVMMYGMLLFFFWTSFGRSLLHYSYSPLFISRFPLIFLIMSVITFFAETVRELTAKKMWDARKQIESFYQEQYSFLQTENAIAKRARHDIRHHFIMIDAYLKDGKTEEAHNYIQRYYAALPFEESLTYCDHYATNALLTYFSQRASEENITTAIHVNLPAVMNISEEDLTVIIGNLLENAVQAGIADQKEDDSFQPDIQIKGRYEDDVIYFAIENASLHTAHTDHRNRFLSTKHEGLGLGISSVKAMVEKHDGLLNIEQKDGRFRVSLMLHCEKHTE